MQTDYVAQHRKIPKHLPTSFLALMVMTGLLTGCYGTPSPLNGISFWAPRGNPPAQLVAWSPTDPNKILVVASHGMGPGPNSAYILDVETGQREEIAQSETGNFTRVAWAPDGIRVLIKSGERTEGFEPPGWWMVNVGDKSIAYLGDYLGVSWSPDGKTIAAFSGENEDGTMTSISLQLIRPDKKPEVIYATESPGFVSGPTWSPDGKLLAFSFGASRAGDLYVLNLQTREATKITEDKLNSQLAWSPQGNIIAVERREPDSFRITLHLITADGKCDVQIPNVDYPSSPTWSPDGKRLAYVTKDGVYSLVVNTILERDVYGGLCQ